MIQCMPNYLRVNFLEHIAYTQPIKSFLVSVLFPMFQAIFLYCFIDQFFPGNKISLKTPKMYDRSKVQNVWDTWNDKKCMNYLLQCCSFTAGFVNLDDVIYVLQIFGYKVSVFIFSQEGKQSKSIR